MTEAASIRQGGYRSTMVRLIASPDACFARRSDVQRDRTEKLLGSFIPILLPPTGFVCEQGGMAWLVDPSFVLKTTNGEMRLGMVCEHMIELD